jgi:hypothetical protein
MKRKIVTHFLFFGLIFLFLNCSTFTSTKEVSRVTSPDTIIDAVTLEQNYGATSGFFYQVYLVEHGKEPKSGDLIFKADHVEGLNITWREIKILEIKVKEARIFHFTNFWSVREVEQFHYIVAIELKPSQNETIFPESDRSF